MFTDKKPGEPDTTPWDEKTAEQRAAVLLDHLTHEHITGNLRPASAERRGPRAGAGPTKTGAMRTR